MPLPILSIPANPAAPAIVPLHLGHDPLINIVLEDERSGVAAVEVVAAEAGVAGAWVKSTASGAA